MNQWINESMNNEDGVMSKKPKLLSFFFKFIYYLDVDWWLSFCVRNVLYLFHSAGFAFFQSCRMFCIAAAFLYWLTFFRTYSCHSLFVYVIEQQRAAKSVITISERFSRYIFYAVCVEIRTFVLMWHGARCNLVQPSSKLQPPSVLLITNFFSLLTIHFHSNLKPNSSY